MRPPPMRCPGCGTFAVPVVRLFGYPTPDGLALLRTGDAEIAGGCVFDDRRRSQAPYRCRRCRKHLTPPEEGSDG